MSKMRINLFFLFSALFFLTSCEPELNFTQPKAGDADFAVYIAMGCSKTAGYANNELYKSGQMVSYPYIISRQLLHVGGGEFKQPLMKDELGFGKKRKLQVIVDCNSDSVLSPVAVGGIPDESNIRNIYREEGPFHNLAVPGARIQYLLMPVNTTPNPFMGYYNRFSSSATASVTDDAVAREATFFSLWIGDADIFDYAMAGGGAREIISPADFENTLEVILNRLTEKGAKGIIANIPDILKYPYFNETKTQGLWVTDPTVGLGKRQIMPGEKILMSASQSIKCEGLGTIDKPIGESRYLNNDQVNVISSRIHAFNEIIHAKALKYNLAFADVHELINNNEAGLVFDGITFNNTFLMGGFFGIDGFSLTRRGNAIIANFFIDAINRRFHASVPRVSVTQFQGIEFP
jgi:hypothetical protein